MPYSVELRFDDALADHVAGMWRTLAGLDVCPLPAGEAAPHVSLAVYDAEASVDPDRLAGLVDRLAADAAPLPVTFASLGVFPTDESVLFLAPVVTPPLLALHATWHALAADLAPACRRHYLPGSWVPHCTLGIWLSPTGLGTALGHLREHRTPPAGRLEAVALIRAEPAEVLHRRACRAP